MHSLESVVLRVAVVIAVTNLLLGLFTPLVYYFEDNGFNLWSIAWDSVRQKKFNSADVGVGVALLFIGIILMVVILIVFLLATLSRELLRFATVAGRVAVVVTIVGIAVLVVYYLGPSGVRRDDAGPAFARLAYGSISALIVMFGMRRYWEKPIPE